MDQNNIIIIYNFSRFIFSDWFYIAIEALCFGVKQADMESDQIEMMNGDELSNQLDVVVSNKVGALDGSGDYWID